MSQDGEAVSIQDAAAGDAPTLAADLRPRMYWCFISYAHADNKQEGRQWASWLHQALETYEVPDDLVGTLNERGEKIPERIFPVFRDEEELSTGDLTKRIYEALDSTRVLVVLCSPRSASSKYVENEIRYFKSLEKNADSGAIHAAIIDGGPDTRGAAEVQCFPLALRHEVAGGQVLEDKPVIPLAADFRLPDGSQGWTTPEGHRRVLETGQDPPPRSVIDKQVTDHRRQVQSSLLKLIAGILGVSFGALQKRDKAHN